jgi:hypothetical protein
VRVWNADSDSTLTAQTASAAADGPNSAGGSVLARASRQSTRAVCALRPVTAARTLASVTAAASPSSPAVTAGASGAVAIRRPATR